MCAGILPCLLVLAALSSTETFVAVHRKGNWSQVGDDLNSLNILEKAIRTVTPPFTSHQRGRKKKSITLKEIFKHKHVKPKSILTIYSISDTFTETSRWTKKYFPGVGLNRR